MQEHTPVAAEPAGVVAVEYRLVAEVGVAFDLAAGHIPAAQVVAVDMEVAVEDKIQVT